MGAASSPSSPPSILGGYTNFNMAAAEASWQGEEQEDQEQEDQEEEEDVMNAWEGRGKGQQMGLGSSRG